MSVIGLDLEQIRKLMIDDFDQLANTVQKSALFIRYLCFLISSWWGHHRDTVVGEGLGRFVSADVSLVSQNAQVGMIAKHFKAHFQIKDIGRCQFEIEDQIAKGDEQMQFISEDCLLLLRYFTVGGSESPPIAHRARYKIELYDRQGHTVNHTLLIQCNIQSFQDYLADQVNGIHQVTPQAIETALRWNIREQIGMFSPLAPHFCFQIPPTTLAN
jgi:hypothetical protein